MAGTADATVGAYRADDTDLHVLELTHTLIGCEDRRSEIERLYFDVLHRAATYEVHGGELRIDGENGELRFEAASDESEGGP